VIEVAQQWYASHFVDADFAQALDNQGTLVGVYRREPAGGPLLLLGLASVAPDTTLLRYDTPVPVLQFPLELGSAWTALEREAVGVYDGVAYPFQADIGGTVTLLHSYSFEVDAAGTVTVPAGTFQALRLRAVIELKAVNDVWPQPIGVTKTRVRSFLAECAPLLARVRSVVNELNDDFVTASEYRRLGDAGGGQ